MESSAGSVGMSAGVRNDVREAGCADRAAEFLRREFADSDGSRRFHTAVILGSGLGRAGDEATANGGRSIDYRAVPGMPVPLVDGHDGRIVAGGTSLEGVLLLQGRIHHYEGHSWNDITFCVRMVHQLGVRRLVITNSAGGIHPKLRPGNLMLIDGHLNPLNMFGRGYEGNAIVPRTGRVVWDSSLLNHAASQPTSLDIHRGVYAWMPGPNYETPAEIRMLRTLGANAVGMSTVPEALCAAELGMQILGVSCITNAAAGLGNHPLSHDEVSETAGRVEKEFCAWLFGMIAND